MRLLSVGSSDEIMTGMTPLLAGDLRVRGWGPWLLSCLLIIVWVIVQGCFVCRQDNLDIELKKIRWGIGSVC